MRLTWPSFLALAAISSTVVPQPALSAPAAAGGRGARGGRRRGAGRRRSRPVSRCPCCRPNRRRPRPRSRSRTPPRSCSTLSASASPPHDQGSVGCRYYTGRGPKRSPGGDCLGYAPSPRIDRARAGSSVVMIAMSGSSASAAMVAASLTVHTDRPRPRACAARRASGPSSAMSGARKSAPHARAALSSPVTRPAGHLLDQQPEVERLVQPAELGDHLGQERGHDQALAVRGLEQRQERRVRGRPPSAPGRGRRGRVRGRAARPAASGPRPRRSGRARAPGRRRGRGGYRSRPGRRRPRWPRRTRRASCRRGRRSHRGARR